MKDRHKRLVQAVQPPEGHVLHANDGAETANRAGVINLRSRETNRVVTVPSPDWTRQLVGRIANAGRSETGEATRIASNTFAVVAPLPGTDGAEGPLWPTDGRAFLSALYPVSHGASSRCFACTRLHDGFTADV